MTANESWNKLCDLEEHIPGVEEHTAAGGLALNQWEEWRWNELGWQAVATYALARQAEAAQAISRMEAKEVTK